MALNILIATHGGHNEVGVIIREEPVLLTSSSSFCVSLSVCHPTFEFPRIDETQV
jgi:hypothetical protein